MTSTAKVNFGSQDFNLKYVWNQLSPKNSLINQSSSKVNSSFSPHNYMKSGLNTVNAAKYPVYEPSKDINFSTYQAPLYSMGARLPLSPSAGITYQNNNSAFSNPSSKVTFGSKTYTSAYTPLITQGQKYALNPTYQSYTAYQQPVQMVAQPFRTEKISEKIASIQPTVQAKDKISNPVVQPVKKKTKKTKCPNWLWPLIAFLAVIALILGLLFGLGVFGKIGRSTPPVIQGESSVSANTEQKSIQGETSGSLMGANTTSKTTLTKDTATTINGDVAGIEGLESATSSAKGYSISQQTIIVKKNQTSTTPATSVNPSGVSTSYPIKAPIAQNSTFANSVSVDTDDFLEPTEVIAPEAFPVTTIMPRTSSSNATAKLTNNDDGVSDLVKTSLSVSQNKHPGYGSNLLYNDVATGTTAPSSIGSAISSTLAKQGQTEQK